MEIEINILSFCSCSFLEKNHSSSLDNFNNSSVPFCDYNLLQSRLYDPENVNEYLRDTI